MKSGVFTRAKSPFVEMEAYRSDSYSTFVKRAVSKCHIRGKKNHILSLFKTNGARVLDEQVTIKGKSKPWTLGNYLLLMKKSPNSVKMGVGYLEMSTDSTSSNEEV